jgi:hypothetical protein
MLIGYIKISDLVAEQDRTRAEVLCPLFGIFLGSYDPNSRTEGPAREAYEQAFTTIRHVHADVLHCTDPIVPGRSSSPKPTSLGPLGLLPEPPVPEPVAVVRPTANQSTPSQRPAVRRQVVHAPRTNTSKAKTKTSGGKTKSSGGSLLGSVTRAVPKVVPKVDVGGDVNLGPVKTKLRLHT